MYDLAEKFPEKPSQTAELSEEIEYTYRMLENIGADVLKSNNSKVIALYEHIKELLDTDKIREIRSKNDEKAHLGTKQQTVHFLATKAIWL